MSGRLVRVVLLFILFGAGAFLHLWLTLTDTSTEDEHVHIYAGMLLVREGRTTINLEHPPLAKLLAAASLQLANPSAPERVELSEPDRLGYAVAKFVYRNRLPIRTILIASRIPFLLLTVLLAIIVFLFANETFGAYAAGIATALTLFSPIVLAVGHLVHTDLLVTILVTAAWLGGIRWIETRRSGWAVAVGVLFGLALLAKYSALLFLAAFAVMGVMASRRRAQMALILVVAIGTLWLGMLASYRSADESPFSLYLAGIQSFAARGSIAVNYLAGDFSTEGWWHYFLVAFALKTPLGVLLLLVIAAIIRERQRDRMDLFIALPIVVYFAASLFSPYNIGVRHLLPVYPFIHLFIARGLATMPEAKLLRWAGAGLVTLAVAETLVIYPHVMGFFNLVAGPRNTATFILSDSNVDWGQDNGRLRTLLRRKRWLPARVLLMGGALPEVEVGLGVERIDPRAEPKGFYAVSRTLLVELTQFAALPADHPMRQRLRLQPRFSEPYGLFLLNVSQRGKRIGMIGNSIDVYEVP